MDNEMRTKVINLAASYFANWKYYSVTHEYDEAARYSAKYDGAKCAAALLGIEEAEIEEAAWKQYGDEIGKAYEANNATW